MKKTKKHKAHHNDKDRSKKLLKYMEENDKPRFKSYSKKHGIDIKRIRLDGDCSLLHLSAKLGNVDFTRYFLKKGIDPLYMNADGDLALHLAVGFALRSSDKHAYTDLLLPLISKCPDSLDVANARDVTCRQLLQHYKESRCIISDTETSSSSSSSSSGAEDVEENWNRRMGEELADEYDENWGAYEQDFTATNHPESYDDWADRIFREHGRKKRQWCPQHKTRRPYAWNGQTGSGQGSDPKRPRISEEQKRAFEAHLKEAKMRAEIQKKRCNEVYKARVDRYEAFCRRVFEEESLKDKDKSTDSSTASKVLKYGDIPWPMSKHKVSEKDATGTDLAKYLFEGLPKSSEDYKKYLKVQQRRWHPDRFLQKCGSRLADRDRERIIAMVTTISQQLNKLSEEEKPAK